MRGRHSKNHAHKLILVAATTPNTAVFSYVCSDSTYVYESGRASSARYLWAQNMDCTYCWARAYAHRTMLMGLLAPSGARTEKKTR